MKNRIEAALLGMLLAAGGLAPSARAVEIKENAPAPLQGIVLPVSNGVPQTVLLPAAETPILTALPGQTPVPDKTAAAVEQGSLVQLKLQAGPDAVAGSAKIAAPQAAAIAPARKRFAYEDESVARVRGVYDKSGKPLDRYFRVSESKVRQGYLVSTLASAFNQEFDQVAKEECAAAGGKPVSSDPRNARQTPSMEADTFFNPLAWGWTVSLQRYFRCEDDAGNVISAAR